MKIQHLTLLIAITSFACQAQKPTANQVVENIKDNLTCDWNKRTVDTFKAGDPNTEVQGVASVFMATMDVLKDAKKQGLNFVITHEPTFYSHTDNLKTHENTEVQKAKLDFIKANNMVVWRFHDHMHRASPDQIYEGVVDLLEWNQYRKEGKAIFELQQQTLEELVEEMKSKLGANTIRVVGNPKAIFSKVGLVLGAAGTQAHFRMMADSESEVLVVGETNEWETVPYVQDAISQGKNKALIVLGHADSEEAGMIYFKDWLKKLYPNLPVAFIKAGNPYWSPN